MIIAATKVSEGRGANEANELNAMSGVSEVNEASGGVAKTEAEIETEEKAASGKKSLSTWR
jgi:hypothetical protein